MQPARFSLIVIIVLVLGISVPGMVQAGSTEFEEPEVELRINSPASITKRLEQDAKKKEYLFKFPGMNRILDPWDKFKADLGKKYGFKFGISYTMLYQKTNDNFGPEDEAASFDLDISGTWTFLGRDTDSPTMLGFGFFWRDTLGTDLPPQVLFTQFGSLYSNAAPFGEEDPVIGELYIQKKFKNVFGFRIGKVFPITAYDFFPFKPLPRLMLRVGAHDANADVQKSGFDTYDGELFTIFEVGYDTGLLPRIPGGPPQGHVHLSLWHQDESDDDGIDESLFHRDESDDDEIDDGWGIAASAVQRFGRFTPFVRFGYADVSAGGPTPAKYMANVGLVIDNIFGQDKDRIGVAYTWSDPVDSSLDNQGVIDAYYRVQLTPKTQIGPTFEVIFDPVVHPDEDTVFLWGFRTRIAL
jgi:porin